MRRMDRLQRAAGAVPIFTLQTAVELKENERVAAAREDRGLLVLGGINTLLCPPPWLSLLLLLLPDQSWMHRPALTTLSSVPVH